MRNKFGEIEAFIPIHKADIIILSETWLKEQEVQFNVTGYLSVHP